MKTLFVFFGALLILSSCSSPIENSESGVYQTVSSLSGRASGNTNDTANSTGNSDDPSAENSCGATADRNADGVINSSDCDFIPEIASDFFYQSPGQSVKLELPEEYQGFCDPDDPTVIWESSNELPSGSYIDLVSECSPSFVMTDSFNSTDDIILIGRLPLPDNRALEYTLKIRPRLYKPDILFPQSPVLLNENTRLLIKTYSGLGTWTYLRDYLFSTPTPTASSLPPTFVSEVTIDEPNGLPQTDIQLSIHCESPQILSNKPGCENACPFTAEFTPVYAINNQIRYQTKIKWIYDIVENPSLKGQYLLVLDNKACFTSAGASGGGHDPINIYLEATSPAGTTEKHVFTVGIEVN